MSRSASIRTAVHNHFARIAAPEPRENEVRLVQDAEIWTAKLDTGVEAIHPIAQGRKAWLHVAKGEIKIGEDTLKAGDAAAITDQGEVAIKSNEPSEVLLFDLVSCNSYQFSSAIIAA